MTVFEQVLQDPDLSVAIIDNLLYEIISERHRLSVIEPRTTKRCLHLARWLCAAWKDEQLWRQLCQQHWPLAAQLQGVPSYRGLFLSMFRSHYEMLYSNGSLLTAQKARPEQFQFILEVDVMKNGHNAGSLIRAVLQGTDASDDKQTSPYDSYWRYTGNPAQVVGRDPCSVHWQVFPDVELLRQCGLEATVGSVEAWEESATDDAMDLVDLLEANAAELSLKLKVYTQSKNKTCVLVDGESPEAASEIDSYSYLMYFDHGHELLPFGIDASDETDVGGLLDSHRDDILQSNIWLGPAPDGEGDSMVWKLVLNMSCDNEHRTRGGVFCMLDKLDERMWY
jgi:hypothetical protein